MINVGFNFGWILCGMYVTKVAISGPVLGHYSPSIQTGPCIHNIMFSCMFTNKVKYLVCGSIAHQILQNDGYGILCRVVYKKKNTSTPAAS